LGFFHQRNKKKEREREEIDPSTDVWERGDLQFEPVQCKWRAGYTKNAGGASRGDETGREGGCGLRGFAAGGEKAPQLYAFVKRDTREKAPNKEALGPLNYTAFLFCP
jgi:hypothetical protein